MGDQGEYSEGSSWVLLGLPTGWGESGSRKLEANACLSAKTRRGDHDRHAPVRSEGPRKDPLKS